MAIIVIVGVSFSFVSYGAVPPDDQQAPTREELPDQVKEAIKQKKESVEIPVSPTLSEIFKIHYANPTHATPLGTDCGSDSTSYLQWQNYHWSSFPVTYTISATGDRKQAVVDGFNTWDAEEHPAGVFFKEAQGRNRAKVSVKWRFYDGPGNVLAVTTVYFNPSTGEIGKANVIFDSGDSWAVYPSLSCNSQGNAFDIEDVSTHELGHVIGLDHVNAPTLTMHPYASLGETLKRTLGTGDKMGIASIYP